MSLRSISEEFVGFLRSLGVTGPKRVELDDVLRLQAALADYRHFRPRLNAQVCFHNENQPSVVGEFSFWQLKARDAVAIWPLYVFNHSDGDVIMFHGGIRSEYDNATASSTTQPVGSKGLVAQSQIARGSLPAPDPNTIGGGFRLSDLVGGSGRVGFSFPGELGAWVYQPEASEFGPSVLTFFTTGTATNFQGSFAWLEVRAS